LLTRLLHLQEASEISPEQIDQVLGCFVLGLAAEKPVEIQQVSASGMLNVLPFASANFEDAKADQRNLIMTAICNATQCADLKVRFDFIACWVFIE
jgi:hypothetical protein